MFGEQAFAIVFEVCLLLSCSHCFAAKLVLNVNVIVGERLGGMQGLRLIGYFQYGEHDLFPFPLMLRLSTRFFGFYQMFRDILCLCVHPVDRHGWPCSVSSQRLGDFLEGNSSPFLHLMVYEVFFGVVLTI